MLVRLASLAVAMVMPRLQRNQIQLAVANPALGDQGVGKLFDLGRWTSQDHRFQAVLVIKMTVHGGNGQVMMLMVQAGESLGQHPFMMVVHV